MKIMHHLIHYTEIYPLKKNGIDTVLVGGSVVSIYSDGAYQSGDLGFVKLDTFAQGIDVANKINLLGKNVHLPCAI